MKTLQAGESQESGSGLGKKLGIGLFGRKGIITKALQDFEKTLGDYKPDVFIDIEIDSGGKFQDRVNIFGSFYRSKNPDGSYGPVEDWGNVSRVDQTFVRFNAYDGLSDAEKAITSSHMPEPALENLVGCKAYYILYCVGQKPNEDKPQWTNFYYLMPCIEETEEEEDAAYKEIINRMNNDDYTFKQMKRGVKYLEASGQDTGTGNSGVNVPASSNLDDDLPF